MEPNKIKETLTRVGIVNQEKREIYPSCYLYEEEDGSFSLLHFKELFPILKEDAFCELALADVVRKNAIAKCLTKWNMIERPENIGDSDIFVSIIPHKEKSKWSIRHKVNYR
jgi:hypothetical protein